jgi:hypothetical protein
MKHYFICGVILCTVLSTFSQNSTNSTITFKHVNGLSTGQKEVLNDVYHNMYDLNYHCFSLITEKEKNNYHHNKLLSIIKARAKIIQDYYIHFQAVQPKNIFIKYGGRYPKLWLHKPKSLLVTSGEIKLDEKNRQCFSFNPSKDKMITTESGSRFYFPPNAFETIDGVTVINQNISICIWEFMDKKSLVFAGLTTHSDDKMLETAGSFYIEARLNNEKLQLKKSESYTVEMPTKKSFPDMFTYYGNQKDGLIDWEVNSNEPALADGEFPQEKTPPPPPKIKAKQKIEEETEYEDEDVDVWDAPFASNEDAVLDAPYIESVQSIDFYQISAGKLGWINCDRFYDVKNTSTLAIRVDSDSAMVVRLVFRDINSVMPCYTNSNHSDQYQATGIPTGEKVLILAYSVKDKNAVFGYKEVIIGENETEQISLNNLTKIRFESAVKELLY